MSNYLKDLLEYTKKPDAFHELLEKSLFSDEEDDSLDPVFKPNNQAIAPSGAKEKPVGQKEQKLKVPKLTIPQGSPASAGTHTSINLDSTLVPQKQTVVTPKGVQQKTQHVKVDAIPPQPTTQQQILLRKPSKVNPSETDTDAVERAKWYHDNLQIGDTAGFHGLSKEYGDDVVIPHESEVTELNPNGEKYIHVKHPNPELAAKNEPLKVGYDSVTHFWRPDTSNPNKKEYYKYSGKYIPENEVTASEKKIPEKEPTPEELAENLKKYSEEAKQRVKLLQGHLHPNDAVIYAGYDQDGNFSNKLHGIVTSLGGGKKGTEGGKRVGDNNKITIINAKTHEYEEIPIDTVRKFGTQPGGRMLWHSYNPEEGLWDLDPNIHPEYAPLPKEKTEEPEKPSVKTTVPTYKDVLDNAGASIESEHGGKVYFTFPGSDHIHSLEEGKISPERIAELADQYRPREEAKFEESQHWVNRLKPQTAQRIYKLLNTVDSRIKSGIQIPSDVLRAKQNLLHPRSAEGEFESAVVLQDYLDGQYSKIEGPKDNQYFEKKYKLNPSAPVSIDHAQSMISPHPTNNSYLKIRQRTALKQLQAAAQDNEMPDVAKKLEMNDENDNIDLLNFYKQYIDNKLIKDGKPPIDVQIPTVRQTDDLAHLDEINDILNEKGLDVPYYSKISDYLQYLIDNNPTDPQINKDFNKLHRYIHERGKNDPHYRIEKIREQISTDNNIDPEQKEEIEKQLTQAEGSDKPDKELQSIVSEYNFNKPKQDDTVSPLDYIRQKLTGGEQQHTGEEKHVEGDRQHTSEGQQHTEPKDDSAQNSVSRIKLLKNRIEGDEKLFSEDKSLIGPNRYKAYLQDLNEYNNLVEKLGGKEFKLKEPVHGYKTEPTPVVSAKISNDKIDGRLHKLKNQIKSRDTAFKLAVGSKLDPKRRKSQLETIEGLGYGPTYFDDIDEYNELGEKLAKETGEEFVPIKPMYSDEEEHSEDSKESKQQQALLDKLSYQNEKGNIEYAQSAINAVKDSINYKRKYFLQNVDKYDPKIKEDLINIDKEVKNRIAQGDWQSLPDTVAQTPAGKKFTESVNKDIAHVRAVMQSTGFGWGEVFKSLDSDIMAEQTIGRRDISIALKKSFEHSSELDDVAQKLSAYSDEIVETVMKGYEWIPVRTKKQIVRYILKAMIHDSVRNNEFIASNMAKSMKSPLSRDAVKGMTQRMAAILTDMRSVGGGQLFIDLSKVEDKTINVKGISVPDRLLSGTEMDKDSWFKALTSLQFAMVKSGAVQNRVSDYRIKKFIDETESTKLVEFYNDQVELMSGHYGK